MASIEELSKTVSKIQERNKRVEADKSWETSWTRKILIFLLTYFAIAVYFSVIGFPQPLLNAVVPALAFVLSTFTMPFFKQLWLNSIYKK